MYAIRFATTGGPEVLTFDELDDPTPKPGQVVVEMAAAGVNFIDTYHRSGLYSLPLPAGLGMEGAGVVTAVGEGVDHLVEGDRVAWAMAPNSYATMAAIPAAVAVKVPDGVDLDLAAAVMLQGLTAHYLITDTWPLAAGERCLIHAGAGGVGLLAIQMAKLKGAEVFTTVSTAEKAELATGAGADHVINYAEENFADAIEAIAGKRPLDVVYDGVGKTTFDDGLRLLRPRGLMATFGNASGPVDPISPLVLSNGSLFLTRPTLGSYTQTREELVGRTDELFGWMAEGKLDVRIGERIPLAEAAEAHRLLEGRQTTGKVLLIP
ncbi:MAG: quinone oxidoreductase [Acidimicrobiales bacterium]